MELIDRISRRYANLTETPIEMLVNVIFESIKEALADGGKVEIRGFGSFRVKHRRKREGRNPKTGELVVVSPKKVGLHTSCRVFRFSQDIFI